MIEWMDRKMEMEIEMTGSQLMFETVK